MLQGIAQKTEDRKYYFKINIFKLRSLIICCQSNNFSILRTCAKIKITDEWTYIYFYYTDKQYYIREGKKRENTYIKHTFKLKRKFV